MLSRIRILKAFSSEIKSHRRFYLSTGSCYGISVFYNLLWFCFIIVTVRVTFKLIHLERFRLGADEDWGNFLVTDKSDNRAVRWRRQEYWFIRNWTGWTFGAAISQRKLAPKKARSKESSLQRKLQRKLSMFQFSYRAGGRAPVLSFVVSLRTVLSFTVTGMWCSARSFMVISASFGILPADNEVINLAALSGILVWGTG